MPGYVPVYNRHSWEWRQRHPTINHFRFIKSKHCNRQCPVRAAYDYLKRHGAGFRDTLLHPNVAYTEMLPFKLPGMCRNIRKNRRLREGHYRYDIKKEVFSAP